jgi:predicted dehydrogenase
LTKPFFSVIGCQHAHIKSFIGEMLELGYPCAGIYEPDNRELAASVAREFDVPLVEDEETLLGDGVAFVGCAAVNNRKIEWIERCERYGKHVMLDKPAVTNRDGLERLEAVAARGRIQIGMLLTERFCSAIYTLKQQIDQGVIGDVVSIGMRKPHRLNASYRPSWFFSREQSGGIVVDLLIHDFDLLRWFTGKEVQASHGFIGKKLLPEHPTFYDTANLQVHMQGGLIAQLYADWHTPEKSWTWGDGRIFVTGTEGFAELRLMGDPFVSEEPLMLCITHREAPVRVDLQRPTATISEDFVNRVNGKPSFISQEDVLRAMRATIEADEQSIIIQM